MTVPALFRQCLPIAALLVAAGCNRQINPASVAGPPIVAADMPDGDLAGAAQSPIGSMIVNPLAGQAAAVAHGKQLFVQMNCAGCHGYDLGGAMGPNLTDRYWRYGGTPGAIYQSIAEGRPQGMPSWGEALPATDIWSLVGYIQSYGATTPPGDYQAGKQGDVAALPVTPTTDAGPPPAEPATAKSAHP
jgi:cytochrome c oxidase cbb3-type subunit 3